MINFMPDQQGVVDFVPAGILMGCAEYDVECSVAGGEVVHKAGEGCIEIVVGFP